MPVLRYLSFMVTSLPHTPNPRPYDNTLHAVKLAPAAAGRLCRRMTWSIVAREEGTGRLGIAVATKFFAVGALVPHIASGAGAIATQALVNVLYGMDGLHLLRAGVPV